LWSALVELIDLRPSQRVTKLALRDAPQRVASLDDVVVRCRGGLGRNERRRLSGGCGRHGSVDRVGVGRQGRVGEDERGDRPTANERTTGTRSSGRGVARAGGEGEAGDDDSGDESAGDGLEDPGNGKAGGVVPGECGGDLDSDRRHEGGPGDPDDDSEGIDEGLVGDALAVEGAADLVGAGNVVWEGPAHEVPERPGDAGDQGGEQHESGEALDDPDKAGHGLAPCSAVAVPVPVTVRWSIPARERIWVGWLMVTVTVTCSPLTATVPVCPAAAR
jgi:hypothetical protein